MSPGQAGRTSNLEKTHAFYDDANVVLRTGLIIALFWPVFAVLGALILTPENVASIVPLIELSPLVPAIVFIFGKPFKYFLLVQDSDIRTGARWVAGLIGVELAIGIYFTIIPVRNDPGLVPLLILTSFALFFLLLAQIAQWLVVLLIILLGGITLIFIMGGRGKMETTLEHISVPSYTPRSPRRVERPVYKAPVRPVPVNLNSVCQDARDPRTDIYFNDPSGNPVNVLNYRRDCFGPVVHLPKAFASKGWCGVPCAWNGHGCEMADPDHRFEYWVQFVNEGADGNSVPFRTYGPIRWSNLPSDNVTFYVPASVDLTVRLRGTHSPGGGLTFVPMPPGGCKTLGPDSTRPETNQPNASSRAGSVIASTSPPTSGPVVATKDADVFHFGFWPCRRAAAATFCTGFLENESQQEAFEGVLPSEVKDDLGNDYAFEKFTINNFPCLGSRGGCWPGIGPKDSQRIQFQVDGVVRQATALVLFIHLTTRGSPFPQPPGFGNTQAQDFSITIPIAPAR